MEIVEKVWKNNSAHNKFSCTLYRMKCNSCWQNISENHRVYATQCSHLICHECASKRLSKDPSCPLCFTPLDNNSIALLDLSPSSEKIKALCGLEPSFVLQIASRAIEFYNFQQELCKYQDEKERQVVESRLQAQLDDSSNKSQELSQELRVFKSKLENVVVEKENQIKKCENLEKQIRFLESSKPDFSPTKTSEPLNEINLSNSNKRGFYSPFLNSRKSPKTVQNPVSNPLIFSSSPRSIIKNSQFQESKIDEKKNFQNSQSKFPPFIDLTNSKRIRSLESYPEKIKQRENVFFKPNQKNTISSSPSPSRFLHRPETPLLNRLTRVVGRSKEAPNSLFG